jgi:uracil-DNA glycosylase
MIMNKTSYSDRARSLQYKTEKAERKRLINESHIKPLSEFVEYLRREKGKHFDISYFDPCDGGVRARLLAVAEAPGPKAIESGFVSRNNNDETAENTNRIIKKSGLKREDTVIWNIVPWYLVSGGIIRPPNSGEIDEGIRYFSELLKILTNLRAIFLIGKKAQFALENLPLPQEIKVFITSHPSPQNINTRPEAEKQITQVFSEANDYLRSISD